MARGYPARRSHRQLGPRQARQPTLTFLQRFEAEDDEVRFRRECEQSEEVTVRQLRLTPIGKEQVPGPADKKFQKYVKDHNTFLHFIQDCPKEQFTTVKKKKTLSKSFVIVVLRIKWV